MTVYKFNRSHSKRVLNINENRLGLNVIIAVSKGSYR